MRTGDVLDHDFREPKVDGLLRVEVPADRALASIGSRVIVLDQFGDFRQFGIVRGQGTPHHVLVEEDGPRDFMEEPE